MQVKITRVDKSLPLPEYQTKGAVAFDIYTREDAVIAAGERKLLPSNLIVKVPEGYALILASRSSTSKRGLASPHGIGIIDQDYHGPEDEIHIQVHNFTNAPVEVKRGDRIAQGMFVPIGLAEWEETDSIAKESRGGFGSTGI
jgi:dUTP pyrophosphatase